MDSRFDPLRYLVTGVAAATAPAAWASESLTIFPSGASEISILPGSTIGDVDARPASAGDPQGIIWVAPGDKVNLRVDAPGDLVGKQGKFIINYTIREEYEKRCKKHIKDHPRKATVPFSSTLEIGSSVRIEAVLQSLASSHEEVRRELRRGDNQSLTSMMPAMFAIRFTFDEGLTVFSPRNTLTAEEKAQFADPQIKRLRTNPNVTIANPQISEVEVTPGNLDKLHVKIDVRRRGR